MLLMRKHLLTGAGWEAGVKNQLIAIKVGVSGKVPVFARANTGAAAKGTITITVTSESDPSKKQTVTVGLTK